VTKNSQAEEQLLIRQQVHTKKKDRGQTVAQNKRGGLHGVPKNVVRKKVKRGWSTQEQKKRRKKRSSNPIGGENGVAKDLWGGKGQKPSTSLRKNHDTSKKKRNRSNRKKRETLKATRRLDKGWGSSPSINSPQLSDSAPAPGRILKILRTPPGVAKMMQR